MSVEFLGEKVFLKEIEESGQIWVARNPNRFVYAMELDASGWSLPVWSSREKAILYLKISLLTGQRYEPHALLLDTFCDAWLSDRSKDITELQINPNGFSSRVLILTADEFIAARGGA